MLLACDSLPPTPMGGPKVNSEYGISDSYTRNVELLEGLFSVVVATLSYIRLKKDSYSMLASNFSSFIFLFAFLLIPTTNNTAATKIMTITPDETPIAIGIILLCSVASELTGDEFSDEL